MTLTEYLDQKVPARMPRVFLLASECRKLETHFSGRDAITSWEIPALWEKWGISGIYVSVNDGKLLYTTDHDGNRRSLSCFLLPMT